MYVFQPVFLPAVPADFPLSVVSTVHRSTPLSQASATPRRSACPACLQGLAPLQWTGTSFPASFFLLFYLVRCLCVQVCLCVVGFLCASIMVLLRCYFFSIGFPQYAQNALRGLNVIPAFLCFLSRSLSTLRLHSEQYFLVGLTTPRYKPQRSQYFSSTLHLLFQSGVSVVAFKALVDGLLHPQHLVCIVSGYASCHCQLQSALAALCFTKFHHQHSPALSVMNFGTS